MRNKLIHVNLICFVLLLVFAAALYGQNADFYKQQALECLSNNDCNKAQILYDAFKELSKQTDARIEAAIKKCIADSKITVIDTIEENIVVETSLELSATNLSFNEMGDDEKSVTVVSNVPWTFSQTSDWIIATVSSDSVALIITCEPNLSRLSRKDSLTILAGDKEETVGIEQSMVTNPLLTGETMMNQGNTGLAEKYFQLVAESDNPEEWNQLAGIYVNRGGEENYTKAFELLQKSANANNAKGLCHLGYMYAKGFGTPVDEFRAVKYFRLSAEQGYAPAQYNLGLMYDYGRGVKRDEKEAAKWYGEAAKQGFKI